GALMLARTFGSAPGVDREGARGDFGTCAGLPVSVVETLEGKESAVRRLVVGVVHAALAPEAGGALRVIGATTFLLESVGDALQVDACALRGQLQVGAAGPQWQVQVGVLFHAEPAFAALDLEEVLGPDVAPLGQAQASTDPGAFVAPVDHVAGLDGPGVTGGLGRAGEGVLGSCRPRRFLLL